MNTFREIHFDKGRTISVHKKLSERYIRRAQNKEKKMADFQKHQRRYSVCKQVHPFYLMNYL